MRGLNTNYFHVVFTLPHELNPLALTTPRRFLDLDPLSKFLTLFSGPKAYERAQHQLLPRRLHPAPRTEPVGAHYSEALPRSAVRGQLPDLAQGGRRSKATLRRDRIPLHPPHMEREPAAPLPCPLRRPRRGPIGRPPAMDPHQSPPVSVAHSGAAHRVSGQVPRRTQTALPQGAAQLPRTCS